MGALAHEAYVTGNTRLGMIDYGHAAVFADAIKPIETIFDEMIDDAVAAARRLNGLMLSCGHGSEIA